jgi:hypothetical protein
VRLACVKHAASVRSEPGSNSQVHHPTQPNHQHGNNPGDQNHPNPTMPTIQPSQITNRTRTRGHPTTQRPARPLAEPNPTSSHQTLRNLLSTHPRIPNSIQQSSPTKSRHKTRTKPTNLNLSHTSRCDIQRTPPTYPFLAYAVFKELSVSGAPRRNRPSARGGF